MNFFIATTNAGIDEAINLENVAYVTKKERSVDGYRLSFTFVGGNTISLLYENKENRDNDFIKLTKGATKIKYRKELISK